MQSNQEPDYGSLEQTLEAFQENARQLAVIASDFQPKSQDVLNKKLQTLISGLQELDRTKHQFQDVKIPVELLNFLDQGKNPELYTKECIEHTLNKNKEINGKIQLYKKFRAYLMKELHEELPDEVMLYRCFRKRSNSTSTTSPREDSPTAEK